MSLINKYNVAAPRYTSYPTVPCWQKEKPGEREWGKRVAATFGRDRRISLYVHLPFCESLCTYCGCNTRITRNHAVEHPYIEALLMEWRMYRSLFDRRPVLAELHLGGGTPTFFSPENLRFLLSSILQDVEVPADHHFSFEAHPNSTTEAHLATLYELGFRRLSIGVQDTDPEILRLINRHQTWQQVEQAARTARRIGYTSVNVDLVFGLPRQTEAQIRRTFEQVSELRPERIAFYSYAHVPWIKPGQRAFTEADLPEGEEKRRLYELGRALFEEAGYTEIGMDHFALPGDELYRALMEGGLHRNFMGYTPLHTRLLVGLGVSAISDAWTGFAQNEKKLEDYLARVRAGAFPFFRGHLHTEEDLLFRRLISDLMCRFETCWTPAEAENPDLLRGLHRMEEMVADGLLEQGPFHLRVTPMGRPFLRNLCMALDARLWREQHEGERFSKAV
jgi:oxygen-independent coproporphyrinogen-3 oxidase